MREAVIVSTARTPIGRAFRGAFNASPPPMLGGHAIKHAVERAGIDGAEVDDVVWGASLQQGGQAPNIARLALLRAGLPTSVSGQSMDRQCASGLMAIATAAKQIIVDGMQITVGGGQDSISMVQTNKMRVDPDPGLIAMHSNVYMPMIDTAEIVAKELSAADVLASFDRHARLLDVAPKASVTCSDTDDQCFIDLAVAHKAQLLSKDKAVISMTKRLLAHGVIACSAI